VSEAYPRYDVLAKWRSPSFDETTRDVLRRRLSPPEAPRFFTADAFATLQAVSMRLLPQDDREDPIPLAALADLFFADGRDEGFWNENMPPPAEAWRRGLAAIEAEAKARSGGRFADMTAQLQDGLLADLQAGRTQVADWRGMDPAAFFRDGLLKTLAGLYYAHPAAWTEIGFGGPASPRGYVRLGFDERDPWEAEERR
jgi:hypothetical protein